MPKKKTGARKKAEKQAERQRDIRSSDRGLAIHPCNQLMGWGSKFSVNQYNVTRTSVRGREIRN